jgi:hypothetical protein
MNAHRLRLVSVGVLVTLFVLSLSFFVYGNYLAGMPLEGLIISTPILGIPLGLLYFSIGLIVEAWQQHRQGRLNTRMAKFLYRTPRFAGILIALFTGAFALDVFEMEGDIWQKIGGFLIHAAPSIILIVVLVFAWRREWIGALVFGLCALFFLRFVIGSTTFGFGNLLLFVLPMAVVAMLFWLNWQWREEIRNINLHSKAALP